MTRIATSMFLCVHHECHWIDLTAENFKVSGFDRTCAEYGRAPRFVGLASISTETKRKSEFLTMYVWSEPTGIVPPQ